MRGVRTFFLDLGRAAQVPPVLHRAPPFQGALDPSLLVVPELLAEQPHEFVGADAPPVPLVEELVLRPAEEALHRGVVGAASLGRHASHQPVLLADGDPPGPAVVAALVGVDHRPRSRTTRGERLEQGRVGQLRGRPASHRPGARHLAEAVEHGAQVGLRAVGQPELRDARESRLVGRRGAKPAPDQVLRAFWISPAYEPWPRLLRLW